MKHLLTILSLLFSTVLFSQKTTAYEVQEAKFDGKEWVWSDFKKCDKKVYIDKYGMQVDEMVYFALSEDPDGLKYENCKLSQFAIDINKEKCIVLVHEFVSGSKTFSVMYKDRIYRYLIK